MIREICKDEAFLAQKAEPATIDDLPVARDLLDTLAAHKSGCVGMAANMIGINKRIIAFEDSGAYLVMLNPVLIKTSGAYEAEEGCLSLTGTRKTKRFQTIKVQWQNEKNADPPQNLLRLDRGNYPARDRPLRGNFNLIGRQNEQSGSSKASSPTAQGTCTRDKPIQFFWPDYNCSINTGEGSFSQSRPRPHFTS